MRPIDTSTAPAHPTSQMSGGTATLPATAPPTAWRSVAIPSEHGGWSLTAEPAVLGLIVAFSWPGLALGAAAMVAFLTRTPLKVVLVDRWRHRWLGRTRLAAGIAAIELACLAGLVGFAVATTTERFWVPLAVAAPLVALELWYDMRSRGRRLIPELAGTVGIGSIAAAIGLAGGEADRVAWGLWIVVAARSVAAIPYVRAQIMRGRSRPAPRWTSDMAQLAATAAVMAAWAADLVPAAAAIVVAALAMFNTTALRSAPRRAVVIGIQQMVFGMAVIATTAVAVTVS